MTAPGHGLEREPGCDQLGHGQRPEHAATRPRPAGGREHRRPHGHSHGHGQPHGHSHGSRLTLTGEHRRSLVIVMLITITVAVAEAAGAWVSGALVLLADAAHMAADAGGVGLSLLAVVFAMRPATQRRTFGYARAEILAAMVNAVVLFGMSVFIIVEAVRRLTSPPTVESPLLIVFGVVALAANAISLLVLRRGQAESLNIRGAFLEVASDALGAAAVVVTGIVIAASGLTRADPIAALLVGVLILPRTWRLLADAIDVLLEASPRGIDLSEVRAHLTGLTGVRDVLADGRSGVILDALQECLRGHFDVGHSTFQLELAGHADHERPMHQ